MGKQFSDLFSPCFEQGFFYALSESVCACFNGRILLFVRDLKRNLHSKEPDQFSL